MGAFAIHIVGVGGHGCERKAKAGEKLHGRCGRFNCPDCLAFDFTQRLIQAGMVRQGDTAVGQEVKEGSAPPEGAEIYYVGPDHRICGADTPGAKAFWQIKQKAEFTHWPYSQTSVVDDMLTNTRKSGSF